MRSAVSPDHRTSSRKNADSEVGKHRKESFWALHRDFPCPTGSDQALCAVSPATPLGYSNIFMFTRLSQSVSFPAAGVVYGQPDFSPASAGASRTLSDAPEALPRSKRL